MSEQPKLSEAQWAIVLELLERERAELSPEIRHTRTRQLREQLQQRAAEVSAMLEHLRPLVESPAQ